MSDEQKKKKGPKNRFLRLTGIGAQMGVTIFLGAYIGRWLDNTYPSDKKWWTIGLTIFSVAVALYSTLKQVNRLNELEDEDSK